MSEHIAITPHPVAVYNSNSDLLSHQCVLITFTLCVEKVIHASFNLEVYIVAMTLIFLCCWTKIRHFLMTQKNYLSVVFKTLYFHFRLTLSLFDKKLLLWKNMESLHLSPSYPASQLQLWLLLIQVSFHYRFKEIKLNPKAYKKIDCNHCASSCCCCLIGQSDGWVWGPTQGQAGPWSPGDSSPYGGQRMFLKPCGSPHTWIATNSGAKAPWQMPPLW